MAMNFRTEQKHFQKQWEHFREEYRNAGMSEEAIEDLYKFDLHCFNRNRAAYRWNQSLSGDDNDFTDDESPLFLKFIDQLSYTDSYHLESERFSWIDEVKDEHLYGLLHQLSNEDKELLTLAAFENCSRSEIGRMYGVTGQAIGQRLKHLGQLLYHV